MSDRLRAAEIALQVTSIDSGSGNFNLDKGLVIRPGHGCAGFNQLITQDRELSGRLNPKPHLVALHFHDRDLDVWTDHDRLQRFPTEYEHLDLPGVPVSA
jgi:hypothetical protein